MVGPRCEHGSSASATLPWRCWSCSRLSRRRHAGVGQPAKSFEVEGDTGPRQLPEQEVLELRPEAMRVELADRTALTARDEAHERHCVAQGEMYAYEVRQLLPGLRGRCAWGAG